MKTDCVGTQTRPDSAPNGIQHQEDCFATRFVGFDVARFSAGARPTQQTLAAIHVCKCRERLDSQIRGCTHWIGIQTRPDSALNGILYQKDCFATCCVDSPTLFIFRKFGRLCHKLWRQFACASVVRDWNRRWLFANVTLGHKQDLTLPPMPPALQLSQSQRALKTRKV